MIDPAHLPPSVLVKLATLEHACTGLAEQVEHARRDLQALRVERANTVPQAVEDEYAANRESERVLDEWARLDAAIEAQTARIEAREKHLRAEQAVVKNCKAFLHELPVAWRLRVMEGCAGGDTVAGLRQRIRQTKAEISAVEMQPVPSDDLAARVRQYVDALAARAKPIVEGIGTGRALHVLFPMRSDADRNIRSGFSDHESNALLMLAWLHPDALAARLLQDAMAGSISANERDQRLQTLQQQLIDLRYAEEHAVCAALARGDDVSRTSTQPAWAVMLVEVVSDEAQAAV